MKYNYSILGLFFIGFFILNTHAQKNDELNKADKAFQNLNYINAIDIYTSVVESGVKDPKLIYRLANANYFNGNFDTAGKWYRSYYAMSGTKPTLLDNYRYGQVLKTQKEYKKADSLLATYYNYKGIRYKSVLDIDKDIEVIDNKGIYKIGDYRWNTDLSEYPAFVRENQLYVVGYDLDSEKRRRNRNSTSDIYKLNETGKYEPLSEFINSEYNEGPLAITNDGKTMYFSRNSYLKGRLKKNIEDVVTINIYIAELRDGKWKNVRAFPFNDEEYSVGHPALSLDNKTLYFVSNKPGGKGGTDIYRVSIFDDGSFGEPKNLNDLNTIGDEMFPFVDVKDESIYFSSNGPASSGGLDIFISKLNTDNVYKRSYNLGNKVNSTYDDFSFMIDANRYGYFASNRVNDIGLDDIYSFKALRDFQVPIFLNLKGSLTDFNDKPLESAKLSLFDKENNVLDSTVSDENGNYQFSEKDVSKVAYVRAEKSAYQTTEKNISSDIKNNNKPLEIKMLPLDVELPTNIDIFGKIVNKKTDEPINANVTLLDINSNPIGKTTSNSAGDFYFNKIPTDKVAFIRAESADYQTEEYTIDYKSIKDGKLVKDLSMVKSNVPLALGNDLASILNTIYFDYGKSDIRPDAEIELEKIVQVLKQYKSISILIESHTDSRGKNSTNLKLSRRRALSTYNYLIKKGIKASRLSYEGFGESKLLNKCRSGVECSGSQHEINRRSNFKILKI